MVGCHSLAYLASMQSLPVLITRAAAFKCFIRSLLACTAPRGMQMYFGFRSCNALFTHLPGGPDSTLDNIN